jgi:hypothetical protein
MACVQPFRSLGQLVSTTPQRSSGSFWARMPLSGVSEMNKYYSGVPSAAVRVEIDGKKYAYVNFTITSKGVVSCEPRKVSAEGCITIGGISHIYIGKMGDAIAQTAGLPDYVLRVVEND